MTNRTAALNRKIAWNVPIAESRVVRAADFHRSFLSADAACAFVRQMSMAGVQVDIVDPSLADPSYVQAVR